ncbi:MAG TPA: hypothetical protein DD671_13735 [Balneolaceae bacterium]|nr:hypothetical protein [Balneolaceae bacterium]
MKDCKYSLSLFLSNAVLVTTNFWLRFCKFIFLLLLVINKKLTLIILLLLYPISTIIYLIEEINFFQKFTTRAGYEQVTGYNFLYDLHQVWRRWRGRGGTNQTKQSFTISGSEPGSEPILLFIDCDQLFA